MMVSSGQVDLPDENAIYLGDLSLDESAKALLQAATQRLNLSARAFHRILKVSRTISDLDAARDIGVSHLAEALQYRSRGFVG